MKRILLSIFLVLSMVFCAFSQSSSDGFGSSASYNENIKVSVYPNPASDYINIQDKTNTITSINVFDLAGRKIKTFKTEGIQMLSIVDLRKGIYLMQFLDKKEKLVTTQRLSKK